MGGEIRATVHACQATGVQWPEGRLVGLKTNHFVRTGLADEQDAGSAGHSTPTLSRTTSLMWGSPSGLCMLALMN